MADRSRPGLGFLLEQSVNRNPQFSELGSVNLQEDVPKNPIDEYYAVRDASEQMTLKNYNSNSAQKQFFGSWMKLSDTYKQLTGEDLYSEGVTVIGANVFKGFLTPESFSQQADGIFQKTAKKLEAARKKYPNAGLMTIDELYESGAQDARTSREEYERLVQHASPVNRVMGSLFGGLKGAFQDPPNFLSLFVGAGEGTALWKAMTIEAVINGAVQAGTESSVIDWQKTIGQDYGFDDSMTNILFAAGGGAGLTGLLRGGPKLASSAFEAASKSQALHPRLKQALKDLEWGASVRDLNPFRKTGSLRPDELGPAPPGSSFGFVRMNGTAEMLDEGAHLKAAEIAYDKARVGEPIKTEDLPFDEATFKANATGEAADLFSTVAKTKDEALDNIKITKAAESAARAAAKASAAAEKTSIRNAVNAILLDPTTSERQAHDFFDGLGFEPKKAKNTDFVRVFLGGDYGTVVFKRDASMGSVMGKLNDMKKRSDVAGLIAARLKNADGLRAVQDEFNALASSRADGNDDFATTQAVNDLFEAEAATIARERAEAEDRMVDEMIVKGNDYMARLDGVKTYDEYVALVEGEFASYAENPLFEDIWAKTEAVEARFGPEVNARLADQQAPDIRPENLDEWEKLYDDVFESPESIRAEEAAFAGLVEKHGDVTLEVDGKELSLNELVESLKADDALVNAVSFCGLGKGA